MKNILITDSTIALIATASFVVVSQTGVIVYYCHESKHQVTNDEASIYDSDIIVDENGFYCKTFDVGEHVIKISRNDMYYHNYDNVEGYTIDSVQIKGWRDNSQVTYTNTEPVIAYGKINGKGNIVFDDFGKVKEKQKKITR